MEKVICRHGVPRELLSDRGASFLSKLVAEVCSLMGIKKLNTTAYHPQTDGLVERFNRTLLDMLLKTVKSGGQDWDVRLPYVLFAYRATMQHSTGESPFFLLYGQDPQLPTEAALCPPVVRSLLCIDDYKSQMLQALSSAWKLAQQNVKKAQQKQKKQHDKKARDIVFNPGDRVFVYMPAIRTRPAYKLTRPYKGPYRVITTHPNGVELQSVDHPKAKAIRVALNRVRHCPTAITKEEVVMITPAAEEDSNVDHSDSETREEKETEGVDDLETCGDVEDERQEEVQNSWKSRLRSRSPRTAAS